MEDKSEYSEPFIDAILNEDKIVKIGEWYININMQTEKVYVISEDENNAYQSLLSNSNRNIKVFSINDDVLDHLTNKTAPEDRGCGGIGGYDQVSPKVYVVGSTWYQSEMHFNRFGVYFTLKGGFDSNDLAGFATEVFVEFKPAGLWCERRPCGADKQKSRNDDSIRKTNTVRYQYKFYENVRNLNGYYFYCKTKVNYNGTDYLTSFVGNSVNY